MRSIFRSDLQPKRFISSTLPTLLSAICLSLGTAVNLAANAATSNTHHVQAEPHTSYFPPQAPYASVTSEHSDTDTPKSFSFLKNEIAIGYYNDHGMHVHIPHPPSPFFWTASTHAERGVMIMAMHQIFHAGRLFSIDLGGSAANWYGYGGSLNTVSLFFAFRLWLFHTSWFNPYLIYSVAGPTYISRRTFGPAKLGEHFLFQDFLGLGMQIGHDPALTIGVKLVHYSNGDIFPENNGFDVPIVGFIGIAF